MPKWRTPSHVKKDLSYITKHSLKTSLEELTPSDVVRLVRSFIGPELYSTDIGSIEKVPGGFKITIREHSPIYSGVFKIKYRNYI